MERRRLRRLVGVCMVALGLVQAGIGVSGDQTVYAGLGVVYAGIGVAYLWAEGRAPDR